MGQTAVCESFCILPGVYSLNRKINISADDLIIVKHTHVVVCVCVRARVCVRMPVRGFVNESM